MCTVTYLPLEEGDYILTSSRDESSVRPTALLPSEYSSARGPIIYPEDPQGHGTWIAAGREVTLCLLNGAYEKHVPAPPYRHSRGLIILSYFDFQDIPDFLNRYNFTKLEPFTLVALERTDTITLHEIRWDGKHLFHKTMDHSTAHIWSSATLYSEAVREKRESWFNVWKQHNAFNKANIIDFHRSAGDGNPETDVLMNRNNDMLTVSITCVEHSAGGVTITYSDTGSTGTIEKILAG